MRLLMSISLAAEVYQHDALYVRIGVVAYILKWRSLALWTGHVGHPVPNFQFDFETGSCSLLRKARPY